MRQIVLDTETTGLEPQHGHRIIEVGCVEIDNRRRTGNDLHLYIHPERDIEAGAVEVHGITLASLADKPRFAEIAQTLADYLEGAELIIHNAPFDLAFLDSEYKRVDGAHESFATRLSVIDTLVDARRRFPGQRNSLDALCKRFEIDNTGRERHGALLDAQLLAEVYLAMTGGQIDIGLGLHDEAGRSGDGASGVEQQLAQAGRRPRVVCATEQERAAHARYLTMLAKTAHTGCLWQKLERAASDGA